MNKIKKLSDITINLIAAGEVVEKPSSVVKELVENSIDADASDIAIFLNRSGKNGITIIDNGCGMNKDELSLAIQRHTTSKLNESNIMDINSFGFRGEALPSIASVSRIKISSRAAGASEAYSLSRKDDGSIDISEGNISLGTKIEIKDLFFSTPARLKFLKSDNSELSNCYDIIKKLAMSYPEISFSITSNEKLSFKYQSSDLQTRISNILPKDFMKNSAEIDFQRDDMKITGYVSIPTYHRASSTEQYLFVNNRPVKDKLLIAAVKVAYKDFLESGRHPVVAIFLELDNEFVDVNVHPGKIEVRFQNASLIRSLMMSAIKDALRSESHKTSTTISENALRYFNSPEISIISETPKKEFFDDKSSYNEYIPQTQLPQKQTNFLHNNIEMKVEEVVDITLQNRDVIEESHYDLGSALAQFYDTYILSQTANSLILIDQHAAHERLVYEDIKKQISEKGMIRQKLLIPEIVEFHNEELRNKLIEHSEKLEELGLKLVGVSNKVIKVEETPSLLGEFNITRIIKDIADYLLEFDENIALSNLIEHVTETYACNHSIRAGRKMNIAEMNQLIHEMEATPFSGQCNHGRPTYVKIDKKDIEKLFGRH